MRKTKRINSNSIYFLCLTLIHLVMFIFLFKRKNQRSTWILLGTNMGLAYLFEFFILNLFHAYTYKPQVMKQRFLDNIFGAILSQGIYVPITSTFITVFGGNWKWKAGFSVYFYLTEKLFIKLNLYNVHWWKPYFTLFLTFVNFHMSDGIHKMIEEKRMWALKLSHFLLLEVIGTTLMYCTAASRKIRFGLGRFHSWREHFKIAPLYSFALSLLAVCTSSKKSIINRLSLLLSCVFLDWFLVKTGILKMKVRQIFSNIPFHLFMTVVSRSLYKLIFNSGSDET